MGDPPMNHSWLEALKSSDNLPRLAFAVYLAMSLLVVPLFNDGDDLLLFSDWNLFDFNVRERVADFTWDGGKTYLLRDMNTQAKNSGLKVERIFKSASFDNFKGVSDFDRDAIKKFCDCETVEFRWLQGSLNEHFLEKRNLRVLERETF